MFESAQLEHSLDKNTYQLIAPKLREDLLNAQFDLAESRARAVLVLINGPDGAGKGDVLNRLYQWLDAHYLSTLSYLEPTKSERARPGLWKYWRDLPPRGQVGIVLGSWYHEALRARATDHFSSADFSTALEIIARFEEMLAAESVTLVKVWLHIDPHESRKRLKKLAKGRSFIRPVVREWEGLDRGRARQRIVDAAVEMVRITSTSKAPWVVVPAADPRYRDVAVGKLVLEALRQTPTEATRDAQSPARALVANAAVDPAPDVAASQQPRVTSSLDLSESIDRKDYNERLVDLQRRITSVTTSPAFEKLGVVCVFEGNDAAGKGGAIRRVRQALDPRRFRVHQIAAPNDEERARPYLWRFWRRLPALGQIAFFDRSWYGRVLVERVEGLCSEDDVRRAYQEICDFEVQLDIAGFLVVKFWLAISPDEQLRRFKAREETAFKRYKLTAEDWRNREKWDLYAAAVTDMVDRTSTPFAPWTLVAAEDKRFARVKVLDTIADRIEAAI
jgi:AMP-polyphosphate phosphotransferase